MTSAQRVEQLVTRILVPLKRWAQTESPRPRRAEVLEVVRLAEEARQEALALQGDPKRLTITPQMRLLVVARANGRCAECGLPLDQDYEIDHIIPVARFGATTVDNLQALHTACNRRKAVG
jgi:5-methylcytosine-specific restriction endonuclease McrA